MPTLNTPRTDETFTPEGEGTWELQPADMSVKPEDESGE